MPNALGFVDKEVVSFDGTKIFYNVVEKDGVNTCLVFLHGLGGDGGSWQKEREELYTLGYPSIAVDLRGHGLSGRPRDEGGYHIDNFTKDILAVLTAEQKEKVVLIGHCFGAMVSLHIEANHPTTAKALVLIDTSYKRPYFAENKADHRIVNSIVSYLIRHSPTAYKAEHVNTAKFYGTSDFSARRILTDVLHTSLRSYLMVSQEIMHIDLESLLKKIMVPTLILSGTDDLIFPPEAEKELADRIKNAQIEYIDGGAHMLIVNNPGDIVKDMQLFLKRIHYV